MLHIGSLLTIFSFMTVNISADLKVLKSACPRLTQLGQGDIDAILKAVAVAIRAGEALILEANAQDLARMDRTDPKYDRLLLNAKRIADLAAAVEHVAGLPSWLGLTLEEKDLPNGLHLRKVSVPMGVVGMIYEARPNVTVDAFALCFKSGNAVALKGGKEASFSNQALVACIKSVLERHGLADAILLLPTEREYLGEILRAVDYIDVLIPRGSNALIQFVRDNARVPVIETGAGVVHVYYDLEADFHKGKPIVENSKTRRVSVCNALDTLLVHRERLGDLPGLLEGGIRDKNVVVFADDRAYAALAATYPADLLAHAQETDFGLEFLDYKMAVKTVDSLEAALEHIAAYGSRHSESIVTENKATAAAFGQQVDAAVVYVNAPTSYTDGGEFGMGAEIGISTQKLHARGPFAMRELTTYKWLVQGSGQIRE